MLSLRQQIVIIIIILHLCRPLPLAKHGSPQECFIALISFSIVSPRALPLRLHPGQGTELELGLKSFGHLNLHGLDNATWPCLGWEEERGHMGFGPYPASSRRLLLAAGQLEVRDELPWEVTASRPGVDPLGRRGRLRCCTSKHRARLSRFQMCVQLFYPESSRTSWCF